jgi:hypothetical protein
LDYLFEPPAMQSLKGKGEVATYRLVGKAPGAEKSGNIAYFPKISNESKSV